MTHPALTRSRKSIHQCKCSQFSDDTRTLLILAFEATSIGPVHEAINSSMLDIVSRALPDQRIKVLAEPGQAAALRQNAVIAGNSAIDVTTIDLSTHFRGRSHIVSFARLMDEWRILRRHTRNAPSSEPLLVLLLSATPTTVLAARALAWLRPGGVFVHAVLHGSVASGIDWRGRNPLRRALDFQSMIGRSDEKVRFLVLERAVYESLRGLMPRAGGLAPLNHPIPAKACADPARRSRDEVPSFAYIGGATQSKGYPDFIRLADTILYERPHAARFLFVGSRPATLAPNVEYDEARPDYARYIDLIGSSDFAVFPFRRGYYDFSPSGAVLDAVAQLKPLIALRVPIVEDLFQTYGDIGHLCDNFDELVGAIRQLIDCPDPGRYASQQAALRALRDSRRPEALASDYRLLLPQAMQPPVDAGPGPRGA